MSATISLCCRTVQASEDLPSQPWRLSLFSNPGGVKDSEDLRYAALRDYIVRRHYARFDFTHARLLRATEAREVYLSYRIRDSATGRAAKFASIPANSCLPMAKSPPAPVAGTRSPIPSSRGFERRARCRRDGPPCLGRRRGPVAYTSARPRRTDLPVGSPAPPQVFAGGFIFPYVPFGGPLLGGCAVGDIDKKVFATTNRQDGAP